MIRPYFAHMQIAIFSVRINGDIRSNRRVHLLLRWSFDEVAEVIAENSVGVGLGATLHPGANWGHESNGTANPIILWILAVELLVHRAP